MVTSGKVQWGVGIPQVFLEGPVRMDVVSRFAQRAEALGYHSLWVLEQTVRDFPSLEPVSLLCYVSALTSRVRLGTSVLITPLRNPVQLAKALSSLDNMSAGRIIAGVGLGNAARDFPAFGIPVQRRVRRFIEGLEVMKALWTQPVVTFQGEFWQLTDFPMEPKPLQKPHPPLWFGALHPDALRRAVRHADGWMGAGSSSTEHFRNAVQLLRQYLEEAKRDPATFPISKRVYMAIDRNKSRAERRLREWFARVYYNADRANEVAVWGSPAECAQRLAQVVAAGAQLVAVTLAFDHLEQLEVLTQEVIPNV